jgi:Right handed beta helix region
MSVAVDTALRDFVRYTGDGLPNAPVGAPLPIGDPSSGVHNPSKADLRNAIGGIVDLAEAAAASAAAAAAKFQVATIVLMKALGPVAGDVTYLTMGGRAGLFVFTAGNFTTAVSLDTGNGIYVKANTISAASGAWVRIRSPERFQAEWFVDDIAASGALGTACTRIGALVGRPAVIDVPSGNYSVTAPILLQPLTVGLRGQGPLPTVITMAGTAQLAVIDAAAVVADLNIQNMMLIGSGQAQYGIYAPGPDHVRLTDIEVQGTTVCAIRSNGYTVQYDRVKVFLNTGDGIMHRDTAYLNNNITMNDCSVYANNGLGIYVANGLSLALNNCGIEANKKGGMAVWDMDGIRINGGYFERNGEIGYAFTTGDGSPENLTVKADILLLSGGLTINQTAGLGCSAVSISGASFTPYGFLNVPSAGLSQDCHIFAPGADDLSITNCKPLDSSKSALVGLYNNGVKAKTNSIVIDGATAADSVVTFLGTGLSSFAYSSGHNIRKPMELHGANYAASNIYDWTVASGTTGTLLKSSVSVNGLDAWQIAAGDRLYTYTIDVARFPELRGKWVVHSVMYRVGDTGSNLQIYNGSHTDNDGSLTETATAAGVWVTKSVVRFVGVSDTTLVIGLKRTGTGSNPITLHPPVLSVLGADLASMLQSFKAPVYAKSAIPAEGAWRVGERVVRNPPVVAQPKAWVNTVAGSPGTFVSEGNL